MDRKLISMKIRHLTVLLHKEENMYIAECPELGMVDQGATIEEAVVGLKEATRLYLEEFPMSGNITSIPRFVTSLARGL